MTNPKTEYLEALIRSNAHHDKLLNGCALVASGGVDGIKLAAEEQPELILNAITALVALVQKQRAEHLAFVEAHFALLDDIESTFPKK